MSNRKQEPSYGYDGNGELTPRNRKAFKLMLRNLRLKFGSSAKGSKIMKLTKDAKIKADRLIRKASNKSMRLSNKLARLKIRSELENNKN